MKNIDGKKIKFADEAKDSKSDIEINTRIGETIVLRNNLEIDNLCKNGQNNLGLHATIPRNRNNYNR